MECLIASRLRNGRRWEISLGGIMRPAPGSLLFMHSEAVPTGAAERPRARGVWWVWGVWLALTLGALGYVAHYGRNVPSWDEWDMVPAVTGNQPVTWEWLWSQHNEHRIPVSRLVLLGLYRATQDIRSAMVLNVLLMAAVTAWLMLVVARRRGRLVWTDAFLPLVALNLGQGLNFMWGWQLELFASTALLLGVLGVVMRRASVTTGDLVMVGVLMVLLTGTGAHGLVPIPPLIVWALGVAWWAKPNGEPGRTSGGGAVRWAAIAVAVLGAVLLAAYLWGYERVPHHPTSSGWRATAQTAVKALTMSFGPGVRDFWPASGAVMLLLLVVTGWRAIAAMWRDEGERVRAWGVFCVAGGAVGIGAALGLGRDGFEVRYVTLTFPLLSAVYVVWALYGAGRIGVAMRAGLALGAAALAWPNTRHGLEYARDVSGRLAQFEREMVEGAAASQLIARHGPYLHPVHELLTDYLPMLKKAGWGVFSKLEDEPAMERLVVRPEQWTMKGGMREGVTVRHDGRGWIDVKLKRAVRVAGATLEYRFANAQDRPPLVTIEWRGAAEEFGGKERHYRVTPTGDRVNWERRSFPREAPATHLTASWWMWSDVTELRIHPDYTPGTFEVKELVLWVPR